MQVSQNTSSAADPLDMQPLAGTGSPAGRTSPARQGGRDIFSVLTAMLALQSQHTGAESATEHGVKTAKEKINEVEGAFPIPSLTSTNEISKTTETPLLSDAGETSTRPAKSKNKNNGFSDKKSEEQISLTGTASTLMPVMVPVAGLESAQKGSSIHGSGASFNPVASSLQVKLQDTGIVTTTTAEARDALQNNAGKPQLENPSADLISAERRSAKTQAEAVAQSALLPQEGGVAAQALKAENNSAQMQQLTDARKSPHLTSQAQASPQNTQSSDSNGAHTTTEQIQILKSRSSRKADDISFAGNLPGKTGDISQAAQIGSDSGNSRSLNALDSVTHQSAAKNGQDFPQINLFQRMDSGVPQAALLRANPHQVAVGVRDPSLGWIEIQAQSSSGHVSASLAASSLETHASLVAEVPALSQFIVERNVPIHVVSVAMQGGEANSGQSHSGSESPGQQAFAQPQSVAVTNRPATVFSEEEVFSPGNTSRISVRA